MYPLCGAVFIPYLIHAASQIDSAHVQVDLRPEQEVARVRSHLGDSCKTIPFMKQGEFSCLVDKALKYHPEGEPYKAQFLKHKQNMRNYK